MDTYGSQFNEAVAAELRAERGAQQLTIAALAEKAGIAKGVLLRYLNAQRDIPVPVLFSIAQALNVDPGSILDRASVRMKSQ